MMRLLLPTPIGRSRLRSFWFVLSLLVGLLLLVLIVVAGGVRLTRASTIAGLCALGLALPGLIRPYTVQWAYRGWNFAARRVARYIERYTTFVCFATVMVASSLGSPVRTFERSPARRSMWFARGTQSPATYGRQHIGAEPASGAGTWKVDFRRWARASGHPAAVTLLPFLVLLRSVADDRDDSATSANIYTLY
jgi:hypothetical protein